jgi:hypothetical protein
VLANGPRISVVPAARGAWGAAEAFSMRVMEIPPFPHPIKISDQNYFIESRLSRAGYLFWPAQAVALASYACSPNDEVRRLAFVRTLEGWLKGSDQPLPELRRIHKEWLRIADAYHLRYDIAAAGHQARRGGASIGKAIGLMAIHARAPGTGTATVWQLWPKYKRVAHVITAAVILCRKARNRYREKKGFGNSALPYNQILPFNMILYMPDLVIAVAIEFLKHGLEDVPRSKKEPTRNLETVWRIPENINVAPESALVRTLPKPWVQTLNSRRAGNRGKRRRPQLPKVPQKMIRR